MIIYSFKYNSKEDLLCNQDLVELQNLKCSISPRKERKIHDIPQLGEKSKSYKENKYHKSNKQSICKTIKTVTSSPNGILKKINQIEDNYQNFTNTVTLNESSSKITKPSVKDKKVSFNSQISVKHGSKKLIEMIQDENEEKCSPNNQKQNEKEGIYLRNARSCSGNRPPCVPAKQTKSNSFQTPVEIGAIKSKQFMGSSKPPLSNSNYGINQSTVKKEMEPKKWKLNRIRNNNAKKMNKTQALESTNLNFRYGKQDNNKPISHKQREPYKGKINNDALNLTDDLIGERKENFTGQIQRSYDESLDLSMIEENFEDLTIDEDVPFSLKIVPTKHPSLMVSKAKGVSKNKEENNQNSACEQRTKLKKHMNKNCPSNNCKVQPLKSKVTHQREHDRRFSTFVLTSQFYRKNCSKSPIEQNNEIKGETIKGRNVCYEVLDKPSFKKTGSNNVCSIKGNNSSFIHGDIKLLNQINSLLNSSVEEDCEEVKEDSSNACSKPKVMELKRFYSHGMYSNSTESRVRIGVHYTQK